MACPNCNKFLHICHGGCCGAFPMDKSLIDAHRDKIQNQPTEELDLGDDNIMMMTKNMTCVFLKSDLKCAIYEHRPEVCQKFGNEEELTLTCQYQTKDGEARSYFSRKRIEKEQSKKFNKYVKKQKQANNII